MQASVGICKANIWVSRGRAPETAVQTVHTFSAFYAVQPPLVLLLCMREPSKS